MIRMQIIGFFNIDTGGPRWGDATIFTDDKGNADVIDGYCGIGTTRLISALKKRGIKSPYLHISHAHYDHYYGIRKILNDTWFTPRALYCYDPDSIGDVSGDVKSEKKALNAIIAEAKARKISVVYLHDGNDITHGDIHYVVHRSQPGYKGNSDAYLNDGSLCYWFPELRYLTTGDAETHVSDFAPVFVKIGHHGNACPRTEATWLKNHGCLYCWDNDYSTTLTDFLQTGREDCIAVGMKYLSCHGDINAIWFGKRAVIYKGSQIYRYDCAYNGKPSITKPVDLAVVKGVLKGDYGNGDARISALLNASLNPGVVQKEINEMIKLLKG